MVFKKESDFEEALIKILSEKGWEKEVINSFWTIIQFNIHMTLLCSICRSLYISFNLVIR